MVCNKNMKSDLQFNAQHIYIGVMQRKYANCLFTKVKKMIETYSKYINDAKMWSFLTSHHAYYVPAFARYGHEIRKCM